MRNKRKSLWIKLTTQSRWFSGCRVLCIIKILCILWGGKNCDIILCIIVNLYFMYVFKMTFWVFKPCQSQSIDTFMSWKQLILKKAYKIPTESPKTETKRLYIFCHRVLSVSYTVSTWWSAASALSLIYYYWLQGCSNRVTKILDWLPVPRQDPFRLLWSNSSDWMTGGRRWVWELEHTHSTCSVSMAPH